MAEEQQLRRSKRGLIPRKDGNVYVLPDSSDDDDDDEDYNPHVPSDDDETPEEREERLAKEREEAELEVAGDDDWDSGDEKIAKEGNPAAKKRKTVPDTKKHAQQADDGFTAALFAGVKATDLLKTAKIKTGFGANVSVG